MTTTRSTPGPGGERRRSFERFGSHVELRVLPPDGHRGHAEQRLDRAELILAEFDQRLSRFDPASELCALNADHRAAVPASHMMQRFAEAVSWAGRRSGGLVDATQLDAIEAAGYRDSLALADLDAGVLQQLTVGEGVGRRTGTNQAWRFVGALGGAVHRPLGVRLDSGGLGKGLAADLAADALRGATSWLVDCGGDLRLGGTARRPRPIDVRDPLDPERVIHRLHVTSGGVATSGITRRSWGDDHGGSGHHLIDPRTGRPAATDVLQVTALAPTALEAEVLAKTALLRGSGEAHAALIHGGVLVHETGVVEVVAPPRLAQRDRHAPPRALFRMPAEATWAVSR
ncbi:MAG: FAD:protein FMN transferase [Solirubrobacteraceae bacterium]|nr:FAD:protein FMN transferase [Solirubrobacteraceae bacterium]